MRGDLRDRFLEKVDKRGCCWLWTGAKTRGGYGHLRVKEGDTWVMRRAHRVSYTLFKGSIPNKLLVCHTCDNPSCVNPDHLFLSDHKGNAKDMVDKGRGKYKVKRNKITMEDARHIRYRHKKLGVSYKKLASEYGLRTSTISLIVNGKRWKEGYPHSL